MLALVDGSDPKILNLKAIKMVSLMTAAQAWWFQENQLPPF